MPRILLRRMTAADWTATNPVLGDGEPAIEHDTGRMKVGDGVTAWLALAYTGGSGGGPIASTDITDATTVGKAVLTAADAPTARSALGLAAVATSGAYGDLTGTVPTAALPPLAINETTVVADQTAMLALTAQRGDMAIRSDNGKTYVLSSDSPTTLADWKEILAAGQVQSVAGKTGVVTLAKADVGLGSVDNTADAAKAVLSATKLATARTIAGQSFDGTANVTIPLSALTGLLGLSQVPVGSSFHVVSTDGGTTWKDLAGTTLAARPTSRTDVRGIFETSGSTLPAWAITGDLLFKIGT